MIIAAYAAFLLAGEGIRFDADMRPQFTPRQIAGSATSTREGLKRWAATEGGRKLIARFNNEEYEITITEDDTERGWGRAPQPGLATLSAAGQRAKRKSYDVILNPTFKVPDGFTPVPTGHPSDPGDVMAAAFAAEMLHISFYAKGISLPHHNREDFQKEWRAIAIEFGYPDMAHDDREDTAPSRPTRRRTRTWRE